jgi:hypothetical protein
MFAKFWKGRVRGAQRVRNDGAKEEYNGERLTEV